MIRLRNGSNNLAKRACQVTLPRQLRNNSGDRDIAGLLHGLAVAEAAPGVATVLAGSVMSQMLVCSRGGDMACGGISHVTRPMFHLWRIAPLPVVASWPNQPPTKLQRC